MTDIDQLQALLLGIILTLIAVGAVLVNKFGSKE